MIPGSNCIGIGMGRVRGEYLVNILIYIYIYIYLQSFSNGHCLTDIISGTNNTYTHIHTYIYMTVYTGIVKSFHKIKHVYSKVTVL